MSFVEPMLAVLAEELPVGDQWAYEIKWDGVRAIADISSGELQLHMRNGNEVSFRYPELAGLVEAVGGHDVTLDGEIVRFDGAGLPDFELLQRRVNESSKRIIKRYSSVEPVQYLIFDLLALDGEDLQALPYDQRRQKLAELNLDSPYWKISQFVTGDGAAFAAKVKEDGFEGVVAKRLDSSYRSGKSRDDWRKIKNLHRQEFVVAGWHWGSGARAGMIGALQLGYYEPLGDELVLRYAGQVGTGFTHDELARLQPLLESLKIEQTPFTGKQPPAGSVFIQPQIVAEIEFSSWTRDGTLRHASYKGTRPDKGALEVVKEVAEETHSPAALTDALPALEQTGGKQTVSVDGRELIFSNLDKQFYPTGFTKGQMIEYYLRIAPLMLPYLQDRPITLRRFTEGVEGEAFYVRHCPPGKPDWVLTHPIKKEGGEFDACIVQDRATLIWLANLASIEFHTSLSFAAQMDRPNSIMFDLDPGPGMELLQCCELALLLRELLDRFSLKSFAKTSGLKGLQLYVPLNTPASYVETKSFAKAVAQLIEKHHPDWVISRQVRAERKGRILIDWSQNNASKNTIAPYSLRATKRPVISTPVTWAQIETVARAQDATGLILTADEMLAKMGQWVDPLAPIRDLQQELPALPN